MNAASSRLSPIATDLWHFEDRVRIMPGVWFPVRSVVVRLPDGALLILAPLPIDDALAAELAELGPVRHLVAPNLFHHLYFADAQARYPEATSYGVRGFSKKRPDLTFDQQLSDEAPDAWGGALEPMAIEGTKVSEIVFRHPASRTLIVTDLVFNMHDAVTWTSGLFFRLLGVFGRTRQSPLWKNVTPDREAARRSCDRVLAKDFDRLVVAHGDIVETGGPDALRSGLTWMLAGR